MATIVVAPDSFKGSATAREAAAALAQGWREVRPRDAVVELPQADGGEGTLDAVAQAVDGARWMEAGDVPGPDGRPVPGRWLALPDGTAVVELAQSSGLPLMATVDPWAASTRGLGAVISHALDYGADRLLIGLGGSASTDGGAGALVALGARILDHLGGPCAGNAHSLRNATRVDLSGLRAPPPGGVQLLSDVTAPLLGPTGAARTFAAQKGATESDIEELEQVMGGWARLLAAAGAPPCADVPGAGAAGGAGFGFLAAWGASVSSGAQHVARLTGLGRAVAEAAAVITGEGRFDHTSMQGKVVGYALTCARDAATPAIVVAGHVAAPDADLMAAVSLIDLAPSSDKAMATPIPFLVAAGREAAYRFSAAAPSR